MKSILDQTSVWLLLTSIARSLATSIPEGYIVHETRANVHKITKRSLPLDRDAVIPMQIALQQTNLESGLERLMNISHPASPYYGKHLSSVEVDSIFAPTTESINAVTEWLMSQAGLRSTDIAVSNNGWLAVNMTVGRAEHVFKTAYYGHEDRNGYSRIGCDTYHLPAHLQAHIDYITPGVKSSPPMHKRSAAPRGVGRTPRERPGQGPPNHGPWPLPPAAHGLPPALQNCGYNITPACIRALYSIPRAHLNDSVNVLGLFEAGDYYAQGDLDLFYADFAPYVPAGTAPLPAFIDGAQAPVAVDDPSNGGESDIDLQMAISLIYPQNTVLYQTDDIPQAELAYNAVLPGFLNSFLSALDGSYCTYNYESLVGPVPGIDPTYPDPAPGGYTGQLQCGIYKPTRVISISYGEAEVDLPLRYEQRQCNEFMKLALQGHTIMTASGDYGVAGFPNDPSDSPSGCLSGFGQNQTIFNPDVLSACPYILSAGATQLNPNQTVYDPETAMDKLLNDGVTRFYSSGGFSNRFGVPDYQKAAVSNYFANHDPGLPYYVAGPNGSNVGSGGGVYNRAGRGFPDVSANGVDFLGPNMGQVYAWKGTSLSSPLWASVVTLLNEERTAIGKGPIGFIQPVLYENPWILNDITNGTNHNCESSGFSAVAGWDPVTGLGTPNYPRMLEFFLRLP